MIGVSLALGKFLTGHAANEPGVAAEPLAQALEQCRADALGPPLLDRMRPSTLAAIWEITEGFMPTSLARLSAIARKVQTGDLDRHFARHWAGTVREK